MILFGEGPLLRVLAEYSRHYHSERNHQGKGNRLLFPDVSEKRNPQRRSIECHQRLGGKKRAATLSAQELSEQGKRAAAARWAKSKSLEAPLEKSRSRL